MSYSSHSSSSSTPSSSQSLIRLPPQDLSQRVTSNNESHDKIHELKSNNTTLTQSTSKQLRTPLPYQPSRDELDRMERWIAIQERMANLNSMSRQGHTYSKLTVTGNARAIRGNIYDDTASVPCLRNHSYGEGIAKEGGMIWEGDISSSAFNDFRRQGSNSRR